MLRPYAGFVGPSYTSQSKIAADDRVVNWFPARIESGTGPAAYVFDPAPGFSTYCTLSAGVFRGFFSLNGADFAVAGDTLYELPFASGGLAIARASGLLNNDNSYVSMAGNGDAGHQIMIASCGALYCFDVITNTLTTITSLVPAVISLVVYQDSYFIALDTNSSSIYLSANNDGTSWDPLDVAQRNDTPDKWQTMIVRPKEVWLFGGRSTSVYFDSGDPGFPYVPNPSVAIGRGIYAPASVALLYGSPIWLADDWTVRYANGYTPTRVSTHAIEYAISQYSTVSDADGFVYEEQGHSFYVLNFPTANHTWVYDLVTGLWHERGPWNGLDYDVLPVWWQTLAANGSNLVGSRTDGTVYHMSQAFCTELDGTTGLRRMRRAPHVVITLNRIRYSRFRLHMEVGVALASGQGSDPQVMLRWSNDGGQSFGTEYLASAGKIGEYGRLVDWWQLGQARDRVFEAAVSDPLPYRLVQAFIQTSAGPS